MIKRENLYDVVTWNVCEECGCEISDYERYCEICLRKLKLEKIEEK